MYCSSCGQQNEPSAKFCFKCGKPLVVGQQETSSQVPSLATQPPLRQGRGALILTFGILGLILGVSGIGIIFGIPAWVMGGNDLKKIRAGLISSVGEGVINAGKILGILGTIVSSIMIMGIAISLVISQFSAHSTQSNKDGVTASLINISANAYQYKIRPWTMGGGGGSYDNYTIPSRMTFDNNGTYTLASTSSETALFTGTSSMNNAWIAFCRVDSSGNTTLSYNGW